MSAYDVVTRRAPQSTDEPVTQQMRDDLAVILTREIMSAGAAKLLERVDDNLLRIMHHEIMRDDSDEHKVSDLEISWLLFGNCNDITIREYIALKPWHSSISDYEVVKDLIRGLHCPEHNRKPMDFTDPKSVELNVSLLKAAVFITNMSGEPPSVFKHSRCLDSNWMGLGFCDAECSGLIIDYPEHSETLIRTIQQRGYSTGLEAFRSMLETASPILMEGVL